LKRWGTGEIVALLGENGVGKSTLIKVLAGVHSLDEGIIAFRGRDVTLRSGDCRSPSSIRISAPSVG
jgi:ABC-type sugar transport system ATPase subunit